MRLGHLICASGVAYTGCMSTFINEKVSERAREQTPWNPRTYSEELITPNDAQGHLSYNTLNRSVKERRVRSYAELMLKGMWKMNGEGIKFSATGRLLDGQNRLHAIIQADVPVLMLVIRGLDDVTQETMDIGANRNLSDILKLRGEHNTSNLAAVIRALYIWDNFPEQRPRSETSSTRRRIVGSSGQWGAWATLSNTTLVAYFDDDPDKCRDLCEKTDRTRRSTKIPTSVWAPLLRQMELIDPEDAGDFVHRVENRLPSPANFGEDDPIIRFNKAKDRLTSGPGVTNLTELAALLVKTWNFYRDGMSVTQLRWRSGGANPESFPKFK